MRIRSSSTVRRLCAALGLLLLVAAWRVSPEAQGGVTITFPDRIPAGPDFATDELKDPWDFSNTADIGPDPAETVNWSNFAVNTAPNTGLAGGTATTDDAQMSLLFTGFHTVVNPGKNGINKPIDSAKYQKLAFRMRSTIAGNDPQVFWFHTPWLDPADAAVPPDFDRNFGLTVASKTVVGFKTFVLDMTAGNIGTPWTSGVVRGLRMDPNNTPAPAFGGTGAGHDFFYDWVRLTYADTVPGAAMQNIQWSGGSGTTTIDVYDAANTNLIVNVATAVSGTSFNWNSGVLPPGAYTLRIQRTSGSGTKAFTINNPPAVTVTDPSRTSGQDYAATVLANAWDMSGPEDIVVIGSENITPNPPNFNAPGRPGQLTATNTNNDPNITLLHNNNNASGTKAIDSSKYRYLTYRMEIDGPFDLFNGSVARVFWGSGVLPNSFTTTRDILVFTGMQSYTLDLATFPDSPSGGIDPTAPGGSTEPWLGTNKTQFRFDPHEFGTNPGDPTPQRTFHIDDIKLTANPVSFGTYTIHFAASDADGDALTVNLYRDTDQDPANGKTLIAAGLTAASGSYSWDTTSVPNGTYFIYAEVTDLVQLGGSYSDAPLVVSAACAFSLTPTGASVPNTGGSGSFTINTGASCDWTAVSNSSFITITSSVVGTGTGTISYSVAANPARTVRTGTITAGGQTFTVTQLPTRAPFDFDGDGRADRTVFSPGSGVWSTQGGTVRQFGLPGDIPVPGDYDGNGVLDTAVYRPSSGDWFVQGQASFNWGIAGDVPVPADYNGDGITDAAIFRALDGAAAQFFVRGQFIKSWGLRGDIPFAADFDGDGKADLAIFRPASGQWFVTFAQFNYTTTANYQWGVAGDIPLTGDFDGDRKADLVVYRPSTGQWFIAFSTASPAYTTFAVHLWGVSGDTPLALDMDGDRVDDLVIYRRSDATWWTLNRITGAVESAQFGVTGDVAAMDRPQFRIPSIADFDGDRRADVSVYRPSTGEWFLRFSAANYTTSAGYQWGLSGDVKVPGDYDGDGKTDIAVYRPSNGFWFLRFSSTGYATSTALQWGLSGDVPKPADYDGDGRTDLAVYRPSTGEWFQRLSASGYTTFANHQWGLSSDVPVPADYDGDGRADLAVYRPSSGEWFVKLSSGAFGAIVVKQFGLSSDVPLPSDWDGDGRADLAVYRPSTGQWFGTDALTAIRYNDRQWGLSGDVPLAHDFDGDGVMDSAVYRPSTGEWFVKLSSTPTGSIALQWGLPGDLPLLRTGGGSDDDR